MGNSLVGHILAAVNNKLLLALSIDKHGELVICKARRYTPFYSKIAQASPSMRGSVQPENWPL